MIALPEAYRAGLFRNSEIWRNVVAGLATSLPGGVIRFIPNPVIRETSAPTWPWYPGGL